jgi:predicted transcriptional regulator
MTTTNTQSAAITVRLDPQVLAQLRRIAVAEDRSTAAEVRRAVATHVKTYEPNDRRST